jgi:hypothetical protein
VVEEQAEWNVILPHFPDSPPQAKSKIDNETETKDATASSFQHHGFMDSNPSHIFFSSSGLSAVHNLRAAVAPLRHFLSVLIFRQISFVLLQPSRQFKTLSHRINIPTTAFHS